ncbi:putative CopG family helix-turn-helix protein [Klebsiella pneumoniae]|uniref:Putative CopG family helix-turn-helix protein n=1 Tax=Klebsiella pneumoniae TaxID=573 RepID=A0A2X1QK30_KLEPN|nr:putative CopG family helix-turn-helix protein [Klebsiella pneumoniae]
MEVLCPLQQASVKYREKIRLTSGQTDEERAVIDYAASLVNKNRTDFIIELAYQEAKNIILDQRLFVLDNEGYDSFITQLEAPVQNAEGRERLMAVKPEWK